MEEESFITKYTDIAAQRAQAVLDLLTHVDSVESREAQNIMMEMASRLTLTVVPPAPPRTASIVVFEGGKNASENAKPSPDVRSEGDDDGA